MNREEANQLAEEITKELERCAVLAEEIEAKTSNPEVMLLCNAIKGLSIAAAQHYVLTATNINMTCIHSVVIEDLVTDPK